MIQAYLENVQSIPDYMFEFPDNGIVQFVGDNSNGKSVLGKIIGNVVTQKLKHDDVRLPMINDDVNEALFAMQYNNKKLIVAIHRNLDNCFYQLVREDGTKVTRKLRDDGIDELLREFGFLIYDKRNICLQLCETFGAMPFVNTSDQADGEIVNSVITDIPSERFIENYKETFTQAKAMMDGYKKEITRIEARLDSMRPLKTDGLLEITNRMKRCFELNRILVEVPEFDIPYMPILRFDIPEFKEFEEIYVPYYVDYVAEPLIGFDLIFDELDKIARGVCPTCGRHYLEEAHGKCC